MVHQTPARLGEEARHTNAEPSAGWRPISEAVATPGHINVRSVTTYRWLPYKPDGARQMRKPGRWQRATEYGWENADLPERAEFVPNPSASGASPAGVQRKAPEDQ